MELVSLPRFCSRFQSMPTSPRRKNFFRPARLLGERYLAASAQLYREQDYLAAIRAAQSGGKGARVTLAKVRQRLRGSEGCNGLLLLVGCASFTWLSFTRRGGGVGTRNRPS
jgi:hypothetical protein